METDIQQDKEGIAREVKMIFIGPSGVRALPLAAGINEGGHYSGPSVLRVPAEQLRWPLFLVINLFDISCTGKRTYPAQNFLVHATVVKIP